MEGLRKTLPLVGLLLMAAGLAIFGVYHSGTFSLTELQGETGKYIIAALVCFGVGALFVLLGFTFHGIGPNFKYYLSYSLTSIFVFGSLVMLYLIAHLHSKEFDLTERAVYSLHPRTKEYLQKLDKDIQITAFPAVNMKREVNAFLDRYARASSRIRYEIRDPYRDVKIAKKYAENISPGDVFIWTGTRADSDKPASADFREKKINVFSPRDLTEARLTNAIVEVMRPEKVRVYFMQGHGETSLEAPSSMMGMQDENIQSYSAVQELLRDDMSFEVKTVTLARTGTVPDDCSLLICAGPQADLLPLEAQAIARYLDGGGRALFLLDPNDRPRVSFRQWEQLMARYGVRIQHDMVLEHNMLTQLTGNPTMLLVSRFGSHATVSNQSEMIQMATVRTVAAMEDRPSSITVEELMYSSDRSWSDEIEKLRGREVTLPEPSRMKEQPLGVAVSATLGGNKELRMVVLGDSDVFENRFFPNTARVLINLVNWLVAREDLIDIPPKQRPDTPVFLTAVQLRTVFTLLVLVIPGVIFFSGVGYVLVRRRIR
ncbi:MAG: GldG family protein [Candidatus Sumerlaeia bacterium]|nr:GldG family protein [Candidatus Sumerlaeia bacterium]